MYLRALVIGSALALSGCQTTSNAPATVKGECNLFVDPGFRVRGKSRQDQAWITETQEIGIESCGWQRPPPDPKPVPAAAKKRRWFTS
jgi:hypothetical protein